MNLFTPDCEWLGFIVKGNEVYDPSGEFLGTILADGRVARNARERRLRCFGHCVRCGRFAG